MQVMMTSTDENDDFTPTAREAFHTDPSLCQSILSIPTVITSVPLQIKSSRISLGSGLFLSSSSSSIESGREIFRSKPFMWAPDRFFSPNICEACGEEDEETTRACSGCQVAKFCGKKCQKLGWQLFHRDECNTLKNIKEMKSQNLLCHRVVWWQQRGFVTNKVGKWVERMESHFRDWTDKEECQEIFDVAMAVREETGGKVNVGFVWDLVPKMRTNCVRLRPATKKESVGFALDLVTATINHSCDPNAFVFWEKGEVRVRSLRKIEAGEEVTICYVDPTIDVATRGEMLEKEHFFTCRCLRCKAEEKEETGWLKAAGGKFIAFRKAQKDIINLTKSAVKASKFPGIYKEYEDLGGIETKLRTIMCSTFPATQWPDIIEPVPLARLCLAILYLDQGKVDHAVRNALKGKLMSRRRSGPEWVNEMMDVIQVLMVAGSLRPDDAIYKQDPTFPTSTYIQTVTYGYMYETCKKAGEIFGGGSEYTKGICDLFAKLMEQRRIVEGATLPGSKEFEREFEEAQGKLMEWAVVPKHYGILI
ncbi:hypothetical protein QBC38DRAFT_391919 [Podospora fimiseda]|uniref:Suppressor of anucleate metulae protein B n=1 Tax=Podospora fimiseda TaxID=252190 RepID=A0AAN7BPB3_9PEZI|nr:hypothetical protein QBC38DRAFT_391919 [Podospora fimiseda]